MHKPSTPILSCLFIFLFFLNPITAFGLEAVHEDWVNTEDGTANDFNNLMGLTVDKADNVFVTGFLTNETRDYVTIKYNADGKREWINLYDGPNHLAEQPWDIVSDQEGNVYITGYSDSADHGADFATVKYSNDGDEMWVARYDGPAHWRDTGREVEVDSTGNVYVTGFSSRASDPPGLEDAVTVKYDSAGNEIWVRRFAPDGNNEFAATTNNAIDNDDNLISACMIGLVDETGFYYESDCLTIKYDADGNELWTAVYDSPSGLDQIRTMATDDEGNVYVAGQDCEELADGCDFITIKYDPNGNEKWVRWYGNPGNNDDKAYSLAVDETGNVYVTGPSQDTDLYHYYATIKYDSEGNEKWVRTLKTEYTGFTCPYDISVDSKGDSYVTGLFQVAPWDYSNADIAIVKYDTDGNEIWVKRYFHDSISSEDGWAIASDEKGNVYVGGNLLIFEESTDLITIKYSPCEGCHVDTDSFCDGESNPLNSCQVCDMKKSETGWSDNDGAVCDDGLFCNGTGVCSGGECSGFSGDPCAPGETCDEENDRCIPADDDDDDNDDSDGDDDDESFRLDEGDDSGCCGC